MKLAQFDPLQIQANNPSLNQIFDTAAASNINAAGLPNDSFEYF